MNALEVKDLCKTYGDFKLDNVSFELPKGKIMGFVGQNGAGKTTTIRLILNMAKKQSGEISILGFDTAKEEIPARESIGVVFDDTFFPDNWTLADIEKAIKGFYKEWDSNKYNDLLKSFELDKKKKVSELSRGMKMKLSLDVAMSHNAKLLILDEPTSGLDPVARDELLTVFNDYIKDGEASILFSTHITTDLEKSADLITLIHDGKLYFTGLKDEFLKEHKGKSIDDILVAIAKGEQI